MGRVVEWGGKPCRKPPRLKKLLTPLPLPRLPVLLLRRWILLPNMHSTYRLPRSLSPLRPCRWQRQRIDSQQRPLSALLLQPNMHSCYNAPHAVGPFCDRAAGSGGGSLRSNGGRAYSASAHVAKPRRSGAAATAAASQTAPTCGRGHPPATHGTDVFGRSYASLQSGANGAIVGHGGGGPSGSAGDGMTENFARATSNRENLHAFGGGVLSTSTNRQAQQSSSVSGQSEDLAVFENLRTPEYQRPRGQSKRHATGSASRGRGRATRGPGD